MVEMKGYVEDLDMARYLEAHNCSFGKAAVQI
jgi:hypothetical protein